MKGLALALPFWRWRKTRRRGAAAFGGRGRPAGLPPACQTKERARGPWPRVRSFRALRAPPPPPHVSVPTFLLPLGNRRMTDGHALARGSRLPLGARRGGGWATPTRPLPGDAWQRVRSGAEPRCAAAPAGRGSLKPRKAHAGQGLADCYSFAKLFSYGKRSSTLIFSGTRRKSISCDYVVQKNLSGILTKEAASLTSSWRLRCI